MTGHRNKPHNRPVHPFQTAVWAGFFLMLTLFSSGCRRGATAYTLDSSFSFNVATLNTSWPKDIDLLPANERETLEDRGRPDFIHIYWSPRKSVIDITSAHNIIRKSGGINPSHLGWIYLDDEEELVFKSDSDPPDVIPLNGKIEVISRMGDPDPSNVRNVHNNSGKRKETWHYVGAGVIFTFVDDMMIKEDRGSVPPVPNYLGR